MIADRGVIRVGTSGFSYKEWLGRFYPARTPGGRMLGYYAERFSTVEINYTFRAMPRREMLSRWAEQVPPNFRFALKAPQRITHLARLQNVEASLDFFIEAASALGAGLGPALFQLPPDFKRDVPLLSDFLSLLDRRLEAALEFRDKSWFDDTVLEALRAGGASLCIAESEKLASPIERTAPFVYIRLRRDGYDNQVLAAWAERLVRFAADGAEVYAFLKHQAAAPDYAHTLRELTTASAS